MNKLNIKKKIIILFKNQTDFEFFYRNKNLCLELIKSFKNILKDTIQVVNHRRALSFANLIIFPLLESINYDQVDSTASDSEMERERLRMDDYFFEYFTVNFKKKYLYTL